jgi:hypothetical protein
MRRAMTRLLKDLDLDLLIDGCFWQKIVCCTITVPHYVVVETVCDMGLGSEQKPNHS